MRSIHPVPQAIIQLFLLFSTLFLLISCEVAPSNTRVPALSTASPASTQSPAMDSKAPAQATPTRLLTPTRRPEAYPGLPSLRGINLGDALEAPVPGVWGVEITQKLIETVAGAGFNAIRVPVRFSAHTGAAPDYILNAAFLQEVDQVIGWGLDAGLTVILDMHHFDALMENPERETTRYLSLWNQLARHYQSKSHELYFELLNEPTLNMDATTWNGLVARSVSLIRETNPDRKILIGGINYSEAASLAQLTLPADANLVATFHFYEPFEFTHQGASWVNGSGPWLGTTWEGTPEEQAAIRQTLDWAVDWSNQQQVPLIMGEFGVINQADAASRTRWIAFVAAEAEKRGISWFCWELCASFGIYDCQTGAWDNDLLNALMK